MSDPVKVAPNDAPLSKSERLSQTAHVLVGAGVGLAYGFFGTAELSLAGWLGVGAFGAIMGLELHRSQRWTRFGWKGTLARWTFACGSAAATLGSAVLMFHGLSRAQYWTLVACGVFAGFALGVDRVQEELRATFTKEEAKWDRRIGLVIGSVAAIGLMALWLLTHIRT